MLLDKAKQITEEFKDRYDLNLDMYIADSDDEDSDVGILKVWYKGNDFDFNIEENTDVDAAVFDIYNTIIKKDIIDEINIAIESEKEALEIYGNAIKKVEELNKNNNHSYVSLNKLFEIILKDEEEHVSLLNSFLYNEL